MKRGVALRWRTGLYACGMARQGGKTRGQRKTRKREQEEGRGSAWEEDVCKMLIMSGSLNSMDVPGSGTHVQQQMEKREKE